MNKFKSLLPKGLVGLLAFCTVFGTVGCSGKKEASTLSISNYVGNVSLDENGSISKVSENGKLPGEISISTEENGSIDVHLDDTKMVGLDVNSKASFLQEGKKNVVTLEEGALYFYTTEKLGEGEELVFELPSMTVNVRGTSGYIIFNQTTGVAKLVLTSGEVHIIGKNPVTEGTNEIDVTAGESAQTYLLDFMEGSDSVRFEFAKVTPADLPPLLVQKIVEDKEVFERVLEETGWSGDTMTQIASTATCVNAGVAGSDNYAAASAQAQNDTLESLSTNYDTAQDAADAGVYVAGGNLASIDWETIAEAASDSNEEVLSVTVANDQPVLTLALDNPKFDDPMDDPLVEENEIIKDVDSGEKDKSKDKNDDKDKDKKDSRDNDKTRNSGTRTRSRGGGANGGGVTNPAPQEPAQEPPKEDTPPASETLAEPPKPEPPSGGASSGGSSGGGGGGGSSSGGGGGASSGGSGGGGTSGGSSSGGTTTNPTYTLTLPDNATGFEAWIVVADDSNHSTKSMAFQAGTSVYVKVSIADTHTLTAFTVTGTPTPNHTEEGGTWTYRFDMPASDASVSITTTPNSQSQQYTVSLQYDGDCTFYQPDPNSQTTVEPSISSTSTITYDAGQTATITINNCPLDMRDNSPVKLYRGSVNVSNLYLEQSYQATTTENNNVTISFTMPDSDVIVYIYKLQTSNPSNP